MSRLDDVEWIKGFTKISLLGVCKELGIDRGNVLKGYASDEKTHLVRKTIEEKLDKLKK